MKEQLVRKSGTVGVVLVNWNGAEHTVPCIESLLAGSVRPDHVVVVDNDSRDGSPDLIARTFPDIELVRNSENLGFTGGNNVGINRLLAAGCEYIWILNNDTTVDRACLEVLKDHMNSHPDVAACTGKILYAEPKNLIWYAGATYNPWTVRTKHRGHAETDRGQYENNSEVPFISGCCMFVRRAVLERIGMFDDRFFAYYEDSDWCLRAKEAGLSMWYVHQAIIRHKVSATVNVVKDTDMAGSTSPFSVYITSRNRLYMIRKHAAGLRRKCTAFLIYALWTSYYGAALLVLLRVEKFKALVMSVYDGMTQAFDTARMARQKPRYLR